jgi:hypothetical protein
MCLILLPAIWSCELTEMIEHTFKRAFVRLSCECVTVLNGSIIYELLYG